MDQEGNGRRRSSRLAARGVVTTPRSEVTVKKTQKSSEKPKRSKRKTAEEIIKLPDAKKTKTEEKTSTDEVNNAKESKTIYIVKNDVSAVTSMDVDNVETTVEQNDKPTDEEQTDVPLQDTKEQVAEKMSVTNNEKEKNDTLPLTNDEKQTEVTEEQIKIKDPEITKQPKNDAPQEESKLEPVALENSNGKSDDKETAESVEEIVNNDIGFCVATKDIVRPNGNTDDQVKSTNGDKSVSVTVSEAMEPVKIVHDDTNHVVETDLIKAVTIPTNDITINNDASSAEIEKELDKVAENTVDNVTVSADENAPIVDQSSTVMS